MFLVELPQDEWGNRGYTNSQPMVIEVEPIDEHFWRVLAPEQFTSRWTMLAISPHQWCEVAGPARLLTTAEWRDLVSTERGASEPPQ